ncbi:MAG: glucan biosynthesis glucosyltransferase H, partial [Rhodoblastus sp.]
SGSVMQIFSGRDTGWNPQRRDDGSIPFRSIARRHRSHTLMGFIALIAASVLSPSLVIWMSPTIAGLILAIGISWASGQRSIGLALKRVGLLVTPEETTPPPIAARANVLTEAMAANGHDQADGLRALHEDPEFCALHEAFLPPARHRARGDISPERAMAIAKLSDARNIDDAVHWLHRKERTALLHDRALIGLLVRLPAGESKIK